MKFLLLLVIIYLRCTETAGFLSGPISSIFNSGGRNLACLNLYIVNYNGTTTFSTGIANMTIGNMLSFSSNYFVGADYCIVYQITQTRNGLLEVQTTWTMTNAINEFRNTAINRCGFSVSMDIGYGNCTILPYEPPGTTTFLCICSTNNCSNSLGSCQNSVDQARSSPPPLLPIITANLTNPISCSGFPSCGTGVISNLIYMYLFNVTACYTYAATHTYMCLIDYTNVTGGVSMLALLDGAYDTFVKSLAILSASNSAYSLNYLYEGSTNMMVITPAININVTSIYTLNGNTSSIVFSSTLPTAQCYCTTNNCNANLDLCASGLNYSSALLVLNETTTLTSTASTTSANGVVNNSTLPQNNSTTPIILSTIMNTTRMSITNATAGLSTASNTITTLSNTTRPNTIAATQATTTSTPTTPRRTCFSGDSQVKMSHGVYKSIAQLQSGDRAAVPTESDIVLMLDSDPSQQTLFYTIETESGKRISLSGTHLIPIQLVADHTCKMMYKLAQDVKVGEFLFNDELLPEQVLIIIQEMKVGYYAPMSEAGTLIVNGLLASCYADVLSHQLAHWMMAPLRWHYRINKALGVKQHLHQAVGLHPLAGWMLHWTEQVIPKQISFLVT